METPDFEKEARLTVDRLWQARVRPSPYTQEVFDAATAVIAAALRKVHTDALESAARVAEKRVNLKAMACCDVVSSDTAIRIAAAIRALATKEDGDG